MARATEQIILGFEERLRRAQLVSDVAALEQLIADELQFVLYNGDVYTKQMDLEAHRTGVFKFKSIEFSERLVICLDDVAVVTTRATLAGLASGQPFESDVRYLRTWMRRGDRWQIVAGAVSQIPQAG